MQEFVPLERTHIPKFVLTLLALGWVQPITTL